MRPDEPLMSIFRFTIESLAKMELDRSPKPCPEQMRIVDPDLTDAHRTALLTEVWVQP